jgi:hypothetical protein
VVVFEVSTIGKAMRPAALLATALFFAGLALPSSARDKAGELVGTWRLISATQRLADGSIRPDPNVGANGIGYIIYTSSGRVCTVIGNPERPRWTTEGRPTDAEAHGIFDNVVSYCGTYSVNEKGGYVLHHVEIDLTPNRIGTDRKRFFTVSADRLVLHPAPPYPAGVADWTVTWQRVRERPASWPVAR